MEIVKKMIDIWGDIFVKKQPVCCVEKLEKERGISAGRIRNIKKQQNPPKSGESIAIHCFRRILHLVGGVRIPSSSNSCFLKAHFAVIAGCEDKIALFYPARDQFLGIGCFDQPCNGAAKGARTVFACILV